MDSLVLLIFLCVSIPLALSLFLFEKKARVTIAYILVGMLTALIASQLNFLSFQHAGYDKAFVTTTVTPAIEEILKAIPILYYAFVFGSDRNVMINISLSVGLGFAIFENLTILSTSYETATVAWVVIRGFGAGLMHSLCTVMVGECIVYIRKNKKLFLCGLFSVLSAAIMYHSIYNCLVLSRYKYVGFIMPLITYSPFVIFEIKKRRHSHEDI